MSDALMLGCNDGEPGLNMSFNATIMMDLWIFRIYEGATNNFMRVSVFSNLLNRIVK